MKKQPGMPRFRASKAFFVATALCFSLAGGEIGIESTKTFVKLLFEHQLQARSEAAMSKLHYDRPRSLVCEYSEIFGMMISSNRGPSMIKTPNFLHIGLVKKSPFCHKRVKHAK